MNSYLTGDDAIDSIITTPASEWNAYQIAVANLNPDIKSRNTSYQNASTKYNTLLNEDANLAQAQEIMMNAYRQAMAQTNKAANEQMAANSGNAQIQAGWAISGLWALANNPAAAAATRISAQNQANTQNLQVAANRDSTLAGLTSNIAQIPSTLSSIQSNNVNNQATLLQAQSTANANNAQANYYNSLAAQAGSSSSGRSGSRSSSGSNSSVGLDVSVDDDWNSSIVYKDWNWEDVSIPVMKDVNWELIFWVGKSVTQNPEVIFWEWVTTDMIKEALWDNMSKVAELNGIVQNDDNS